MGQTEQLSYTVTDATGAPIMPAPTLAFLGLRAERRDRVGYRARDGRCGERVHRRRGCRWRGKPLSGQAYAFVVGNTGTAGSGTTGQSFGGGVRLQGGGACTPVVVGCFPEFPPSLFATPNLTDKAPLLAFVCRACLQGGLDVGGTWACDVESPDDVQVRGRNVVALLGTGSWASGKDVGVELMREFAVGGVSATMTAPRWSKSRPIWEVSGPPPVATGTLGRTPFRLGRPQARASSIHHESHGAYAGGPSYTAWSQAGETSCFSGVATPGGNPPFFRVRKPLRRQRYESFFMSGMVGRSGWLLPQDRSVHASQPMHRGDELRRLRSLSPCRWSRRTGLASLGARHSERRLASVRILLGDARRWRVCCASQRLGV